MMTFEEYQAFKERGFSHAPLIKKRLMDAQTPVSVFSKVRDLNGSAYLFESVTNGECWARYSMIGLGSDLILQYTNGDMAIKDHDHMDITAVEDPFDYIRQLMAQYHMPTTEDIPALPSFSGGLVGYFGYDMARVIEPSLGASDAPNPMTMPDMWLMLSMSVIVFDNLENTLSIIVYADCHADTGYSNAIRELEKIQDKLAEPPNLRAPVMPTPKFVSQTSQEQYCDDTHKIKDHIATGEVIQVVPAQRLSADYKGDSLAIYRALRFLNPSPYLFLVHGYTLDDHKRFDIIGAAPDMPSERHAAVMPIDASIEGTILADKDALERFCRSFPASILSGTPKTPAMHIIDDIEPLRRSVFGGSVGYLGWHGNMDTAIAIRTAVMRRGKIHLQAASEITADSVPKTQWANIQSKALEIINAVKMACDGLRIR